MKVAIVYDWIHTFGGAERILIALHELFPQAPLFSAVYDKKNTKWAEKFKINTSFLQNMPFAKSHHELFPLLTPLAFETFDFSNYDLVISVTSSDAKGIITQTKTLHICYLLTPNRYLWSHHNFYFRNKLFQQLADPFVSYLRFFDKCASNRPDYIIAISKTVQDRILQFYGRKSDLVYPPVDTENSYLNEQTQDDYFLIVSRLVPYKHLEYPILSCNDLNLKLVIIGDGRSRNSLKNIAGKTIKFTGNLTDRELISYYRNCRAVIIPAEEDFGIVSVEAQSYGKPVIAFSKGGSQETIIEGKTGIFFNSQTKESIKKALIGFNSMLFKSKECINNSRKYSKTLFKKEFMQRINFYMRLYFGNIDNKVI